MVKNKISLFNIKIDHQEFYKFNEFIQLFLGLFELLSPRSNKYDFLEDKVSYLLHLLARKVHREEIKMDIIRCRYNL